MLLPALQRAGVVDAGAKGFVHLLEGIAAAIAGDPLVAPEFADAAEPTPAAAALAEYPEESEGYRFCTEALVRGTALPTAEEVRAVLREHGDSLVVIRGEALLKVHIHTDEPERVFAYLRGVGELATHKAEDMHAQHDAVGRAAARGHLALARRPISVVADSACDLPEEIVRAHGIRIVPLGLVFGEEVLRDRVDISAEAFTERLLAGAHPSTSQPTPAAFHDAFRHAAEEGEAVVAVLLASALSGTAASARSAARQLGDGSAPVHLFDSRGVSLLEGLLALKAAELGELGWPAEAILAELERVRGQSGLLFSLDTFERVLASGRIGRGRAWLGGLLDLKPILEVDGAGALTPLTRVRRRANVLPKMLEILARRVPPERRVRFGVIHVACPEVVDEVRHALRARYTDCEIVCAAATPIITTHAGAGAWGVAYLVED